MKSCNQKWADIELLAEDEKDIFVEHANSCVYHDKILTKYEKSFLPILNSIFDEEKIITDLPKEVKRKSSFYTFILQRSSKLGISIRRIEIPKFWLEFPLAAVLIFIICGLGAIFIYRTSPSRLTKELSYRTLPQTPSENNRSVPIAGTGGPDLDGVESEIQQIKLQIQQHLDELEKKVNPKFLPTVCPYKGKITAEYGLGPDPFEKGKTRFHFGLDFKGNEGDTVIASASGKVVHAGYYKDDILLKDYGNLVEIDHGNGLTTLYGHLSEIKVRKGLKVVQGQKIGLIGSTGRANGSHVHFEVKLNKLSIDPREILDKNQLDIQNSFEGQDSDFSTGEIDSDKEQLMYEQLKQIEQTSDPMFLPTLWPHLGVINNEFGYRRNPFGGMRYEFHPGVDIDGETGESVFAAASGIISKAGRTGGYGNMIEIDHGNGLRTRYGHLSRIDIELGERVEKGQQIGAIGTTGRSTGPHLHFELRLNDEALNPRRFLPPEPIE